MFLENLISECKTYFLLYLTYYYEVHVWITYLFRFSFLISALKYFSFFSHFKFHFSLLVIKLFYFDYFFYIHKPSFYLFIRKR